MNGKCVILPVEHLLIWWTTVYRQSSFKLCRESSLIDTATLQSSGKMLKYTEKLRLLYKKVDKKFLDQFGFKIKDTSFNKVVDYMYTPKDSSSLAVTRILFGVAMLFDIPDERGGAAMVRRWGDPRTCHFPLLPILQPIGLPHMALVYCAMWFGAWGIALGYKFRISGPLFTACYWYLFLIEKSFWNNHSYLFGLVALLLSCTNAECYWSLDAYLDPTKKKDTVPYWNYFILKYQFFILYFMAGMKKGTAEWLTGYSVQNLSEHWVFDPFKYFLTVPQTDYLVVHWFVFVFDLTVALWMMWSTTRNVAMIFCAMFHLMNSRLFRIGMFPWVCLATMPLFYPFDWPKKLAAYSQIHCTNLRNFVCVKIHDLKKKNDCEFDKSAAEGSESKDNANENVNNEEGTEINKETEEEKILNETPKDLEGTIDITERPNVDDKAVDTVKTEAGENQESPAEKTNWGKEEKPTNNRVSDVNDKDGDYNKKKVTVYLIILYVLIQAFLPYSHFITKGYNNWTNGLYGYSWDMMVHTWDVRSVIVKIVDHDRREEMYVDPDTYTLNDRWSKHGDMVFQYAQCLKNNIDKARKQKKGNSLRVPSDNISIHVDIWCSMNGRVVQRMFDPKVDLLKASWSPFSKIPYLMPLIDEAEQWRSEMDEIRTDVYSWSEHSDVVFYADFPDYEQEKFIPLEFKNVSLTILEGHALYEPEVLPNQIGKSFKLTKGNRTAVDSGAFHKVINIGESPVFYMYTFYNGTAAESPEQNETAKSKLPIFQELSRRFTAMATFLNLVVSNIFQMFKFSQCVN